MWGFFLRGAFWVWEDVGLLREARGRELAGARGTAKRAAETDAGVMGRDALVWSGLVLVTSAELLYFHDHFIRVGIVGEKKQSQCHCKCNSKCKMQNAGPSTTLLAKCASSFAQDDSFWLGLQMERQGTRVVEL
jgi:hypothetical protein